MRRPVRWLGVLIVLAALLVVGDQLARIAAQRALAAELQASQHLTDRPAVHIDGFPFLLQAARGRYAAGSVSLRGLPIGKIQTGPVDLQLRDVSLPAGQLLARKVRTVRAGSVTGTAALPYAELTKLAPGVQLAAAGDRLRISFPVTAPFVGQVEVTTTAALAVRGGRLTLQPGTLTAGGTSMPPELAAGALDRVAAALVPAQLPYGLQLTGVRVAADRLVLSLSGQNIALQR